jgi:hypothetical protein
VTSLWLQPSSISSSISSFRKQNTNSNDYDNILILTLHLPESLAHLDFLPLILTINNSVKLKVKMEDDVMMLGEYSTEVGGCSQTRK